MTPFTWALKRGVADRKIKLGPKVSRAELKDSYIERPIPMA